MGLQIQPDIKVELSGMTWAKGVHGHLQHDPDQAGYPKVQLQENTGELVLKILEAARSTGNMFNAQTWKFILIQDASRLAQLSKNSTRGQWVEDTPLAVMVLTDLSQPDHDLDAGRAVQNMQLAAWSYGVGSGLFTIMNEDAMRRDFKIPKKMHIAASLSSVTPKEKSQGGERTESHSQR